MGTDLRRAAELRCGIPVQSRSLELLYFSGLESRHLVNELLNGLGGGLTNLYELHGRRIVRLVRRQNPPLVAIQVRLKGHGPVLECAKGTASNFIDDKITSRRT